MRAAAALDGSDWDWVGWLIASELVDNMQFLRNFAEAYGKALKRSARGGRGGRRRR